MPLSKEKIEQLKKLLTGRKKICIITHTNPDGDALGSSLGLYHILVNSGHEAKVISPNDYPDFLHWLPGNNNVMIYTRKKKVCKDFMLNCDLIFMLDFNHIDRIELLSKTFLNTKALKILIDHHPKPSIKANLSFSETNVSSTAELVYLIFKKLKYKNSIDKNAATCLYTGIMTDTGCFNYNCSNTSTFKTVSELISYNLNTDEVSSLVYDNYSADRMKLMGYSLFNKMKIFHEFKTAIIALSNKELAEFNFTPGDTEGFVNLPLSIKDIVFSILLIEKKDHVKLSFRSRGNFAANEFASRYFDGGGHFNAAGGQSNSTLNETIEKSIKLLKKHSKELNS